MKELPVVTIITPIFNGEKYLDRYFKCIRTLQYKNLQIILVNDGSNDKSADIIREYIKKDARFLFIDKNENEGVSKARNDALKKAGGKYIFFFDCDDTFEPDIVIKCVEYAEKAFLDAVLINIANVNSGVIHERIMTYAKDEYYGENIIEVVEKSFGTSLDELYQYLAGKRGSREGKERNGPMRMMYRLEVIRKYAVFFPENIRIGEDTIFTNEYLCYSEHIGILRKTMYYAHENFESATHVYWTDYERMVDEKIRIIQEKKDMIKRVLRQKNYDLKNSGGGEYILSSVQLAWFISKAKIPFSRKVKILKRYQYNDSVSEIWNKLSFRRLAKCRSMRVIPVILLKCDQIAFLMLLLIIMGKVGITVKE